MRPNADNAARFLLFHFLLVLVTVIFTAVTLPLSFSQASFEDIDLWSSASWPQGLLKLWNLIVLCAKAAALGAPMLLIPSALGWWIGGKIAATFKRSAARPILQGLCAGLAAQIAVTQVAGFFIPQTMVSLPTGAFFGWLIYRKP
ncbi:hypothetical protein [Paracoccus sp. S1E-3]|uniref:hypothetical protein n=1 Tax=Paracoccus sp. S1E-3 TaxID=2756130 RepID=UPI0015EE9778|nr:hypothetical protein [Paracoccus sp. S1E-3]MBA4489737.1 hypothetical protein [Paracoccus sp. S1E-3]